MRRIWSIGAGKASDFILRCNMTGLSPCGEGGPQGRVGWLGEAAPGLHDFMKTGIYWVVTSRTAMEETEEKVESRKSVRDRANEIQPFRCKNLIAVLENPSDIKNIGTVIRNVNALGVEKVYIVDPRRSLPDDWQDLRTKKSVSKTSVSAVKWTFVKRFDNTDACFDHLERNNFHSIVTSPHVKGKASIFLHEGDYTVHSKLAVWFGSEAAGISDRAVERSEMCISIPMFGMIESLNLGTGSGIVLYEVAKQRREYQSRYRLRDRRGERANPLPTTLPPKE
jgi:tRNA (guanosine-2'-O-)-methyltransferase